MADIKEVRQALKYCFDEKLGIVSCDKCTYKDKMIKVDGYHHCQLGDDALALLEEQTAKPIIRKQAMREHADGSVDYFAEWFCPHCVSLLLVGFENKWIKFCPRCGKPVLWEGR